MHNDVSLRFASRNMAWKLACLIYADTCSSLTADFPIELLYTCVTADRPSVRLCFQFLLHVHMCVSACRSFPFGLHESGCTCILPSGLKLSGHARSASATHLSMQAAAGHLEALAPEHALLRFDSMQSRFRPRALDRGLRCARRLAAARRPSAACRRTRRPRAG